MALGNSYALDSFSYVPFILKSYGVDIEIGLYRRGGGTLQQCVEDWNTPTADHTLHYVDTESMTSWSLIYSSCSPKQCVDYKQWDIVVIQQGSIDSVDYNTFIPYTRQLISLIQTELGRGVTIGWNININRLSSGSDISTIEATILNNIKQILKREGISIIFPYGTAIFDARTNETLDAIGNHLWYSDDTHLQEGLPCYIAAAANTQAIFKRFYPKLSVIGDTTRPTQENITTWNVPGQHGTSIGVTEENCYLAQICAIVANEYPLEICTI